MKLLSWSVKAFLLLLFIVAVIVGSVVVFKNQRKMFADTNVAIEEKEAELLQIENTMEQFSDFQDSSLSLLEQIVRLYRIFPTGKTASTFMQQLNRAVKMSDVNIILAKPLQSRNYEQQGKFSAVPISVNFYSSFDKMGVFLNNLETTTSFIRTGDISIDVNEDNPAQLSVSVSLEAYTVLEKKTKEIEERLREHETPKPLHNFVYNVDGANPFYPNVEGAEYKVYVHSNLNLTMIIWDEENPVALVRAEGMKESKTVYEGDVFMGEKILEIQEDHIVVLKNGAEAILTIPQDE